MSIKSEIFTLRRSNVEPSTADALMSTDIQQTLSTIQLQGRSSTPRNKVFRESRRRQEGIRPAARNCPLSSPTLISRTPSLVSGQRTYT